jgi:hypothetical protein
MKKLATATILITQVSLGSTKFGFTPLAGFADPEPYVFKKTSAASQGAPTAAQNVGEDSLASQSAQVTEFATNPYEASTTNSARNFVLPQDQKFDQKSCALKYEGHYISDKKFILTIADEIDASTMSYRASSSFSTIYPDDCYGSAVVKVEIKTSAFYTNQRGKKVHPILLPFSRGCLELPLNKDYDGYSVKYDGKQFIVVLKDEIEKEWVEIELSHPSFAVDEESMLKSTGLEVDSLPEDLLTIKEEVEAKIKDKLAVLRQSSPSDKWIQTAPGDEVLHEMHYSMGFKERTVEGIICSTLAKRISTNYSYAHSEQKEFKSIPEALAHGRFQCDTAALIMTSILRDHYRIPARIIISYPGVKISGGDHDTQTMAPNINAVLHATVQALVAEGPGWPLSYKEFDPTPKS